MKSEKTCKRHPWSVLPCAECEMYEDEQEREFRKERKRKQKKIRNQYNDDYYEDYEG